MHINKIKVFIIFFLLPLLIIALLVLNANLYAREYLAREAEWSQYSAEISTNKDALQLNVGEAGYLETKVKNNGTMTWISSGENPINISYHIFHASGEEYLYDGARTSLPSAVKPGEKVEAVVMFESPSVPGSYVLELDMVHEGVNWFKEAGSPTKEIKLEVLQ